MKSFLIGVAIGLSGVALSYHIVAAVAWQIRNPKANQFTVVTHYKEMMRFERLEKFQ